MTAIGDHMERLRQEQPDVAEVLDTINALNSVYEQVQKALGKTNPPTITVASTVEVGLTGTPSCSTAGQ